MDKLLKTLTELDAVPGNEAEVRNFMKAELTPHVTELMQDNLGSIAGKIGTDGPNILIAGHMDEVGFMVSKITKEGFLKVLPLGGWWGNVTLSQLMTVTTSAGKKYRAVVGSNPPHILTPEERAKAVDLKTIYLDLGVKDEEKVKELGIEIGDMVTPYIETVELNDPNYLLGKAWDNRIGCAVVIELAKNLKDVPNQTYLAATVQEEVGTRGAFTTANMINPDIAIAIDVTIEDGYPGGAGDTVFGKGPALLVYDGGLVGHKSLRKYIMDLAAELDVPVQLSYLRAGATDAKAFHLAHEGAPSISIGIPSRYIHSHTSMIHKEDYENTVKLLTELAKRLDRNTVDEIIQKG